MALAPVVTTPIFFANFSSLGILGISVPQLSAGLANALYAYSNSGISVSTVDAGLIGSGVGAGTAALTPASMLPFMIASFSSQSVLGISSFQLAVAITNSLSTCISSSSVSTLHPSVGSGTGVGTLTPSSAVPFFISGLESVGITGTNKNLLATAIANGLDLSLPTTVVNVAIAGPSGSSASSGVGTGKIF